MENKVEYITAVILNREGKAFGEICNRNKCRGTIVQTEIAHMGACNCHLGNPPCHYCTSPDLKCDTCDWEGYKER